MMKNCLESENGDVERASEIKHDLAFIWLPLICAGAIALKGAVSVGLIAKSISGL